MNFDQHLHSWHSLDSETPPRENVEAALARGLPGLIFTEHFDTHAEDWPACRFDYADYSRSIGELRRRFDGQIFVGKGIEVCYQPDRLGRIVDFLNAHEFDMVLLSIHWAGPLAFHRREHWDGLSVTQAAALYFHTVLRAAQDARSLKQKWGRRVFDVLGHFDLIKRYSYSFFKDARVIEGHENLIDQILCTCLEADLVPEINTSPLRNGAPEAMPGPYIVRRYAQLGGQAVSLGSDAHRPTAVGANFEQIRAMLPTLGIKEIVNFRNRAPSRVCLHASSVASGNHGAGCPTA